MLSSKRFKLLDKENAQIDVEYNKDFAILHLPRFKATKSNIEDLTIYVEDCVDFLGDMGYTEVWAGVPVDDKTTQKLCTKIGFKTAGEAQGIHVFIYEGVE